MCKFLMASVFSVMQEAKSLANPEQGLMESVEGVKLSRRWERRCPSARVCSWACKADL